jgi:hypothetical protein
MLVAPKRRSGSFSLRLAFRATLTATVAIVAAVIIESTAMPKLETELKGLQRQPPTSLKWAGAFQGRLRYVPVPALVLGIAAIASRRLRPVLAGLATAASLVALVIVVGSLVAALAPMYQIPAELDPGG